MTRTWAVTSTLRRLLVARERQEAGSAVPPSARGAVAEGRAGLRVPARGPASLPPDVFPVGGVPWAERGPGNSCPHPSRRGSAAWPGTPRRRGQEQAAGSRADSPPLSSCDIPETSKSVSSFSPCSPTRQCFLNPYTVLSFSDTDSFFFFFFLSVSWSF